MARPDQVLGRVHNARGGTENNLFSVKRFGICRGNDCIYHTDLAVILTKRPKSGIFVASRTSPLACSAAVLVGVHVSRAMRTAHMHPETLLAARRRYPSSIRHILF